MTCRELDSVLFPIRPPRNLHPKRPNTSLTVKSAGGSCGFLTRPRLYRLFPLIGQNVSRRRCFEI
jgi:hypothetical protein